ncbi:glycosyltransferase family 4 protein [Rhizobium sp. RU36D]|uniref:GumK N-terminal domain-containing glycosyltransferase n=1 Tax=Rhizobium sp. RU36D TaxID=1907415 RepID=UPI001179E16A|nr:glycosyltransferase family 4 protein [Rhizobium sp. RU36D]
MARKWAEEGHEVSFTSIGHSLISRLKNSARFEVLRRQQNNRYVSLAPNLHAGAYIPPIHAFSSARPLVNRLLEPLFALYGSYLPRFVSSRVGAADLVVFESGTSLVFVDLVRRLNPKAKLLYFCRDLLQSVGAAPILSRLERRLIADFDSVCVPSKRLGELLPSGGQVNFVPQGIDFDAFEAASTSPYPKGSRNVVAAGDMLFDRQVVTELARAAPDVAFHLFGIKWKGDRPENVRLHGEQSFRTVASHIRHADIGLAPYKMKTEETYLAESSLKLMQYAHCRLPVILPDIIPATRGNEISYSLEGRNDWTSLMNQALSWHRDTPLKGEILSWNEVARRTLATAFPG